MMKIMDKREHSAGDDGNNCNFVLFYWIMWWTVGILLRRKPKNYVTGKEMEVTA